MGGGAAPGSTRPLVIAHRGASAYRPENTMAAYALALEQGADMLEIDLHLTRDGEIVISHDASLEHLGGVGEVADHTCEEIRRLDAGEGQRVPILREVLDEYGPRIPVNLELKCGRRGGLYRGLEAAALQEVRGRGLLDTTLFSSFYDPMLVELRRLSSDARIAVLVSPHSPGDPMERVARVRAEAVNPERSLADAELRRLSAERGLAMYPYTVDPADEMERLIELGVDGLFTNVPDRMRTIVDARG